MSNSREISLVALEIRKWDLESNKIFFNSYFVMEDEEKSLSFEVSIMQPPEMVEEYLGKLRYEAEQKLCEECQTQDISVVFDNETFLRQKIYNYFKRISSELNNPKRKKGQQRMIFTTHMDVYNETQDISFLPKSLQFFVVLNWCRKYYNKEDFKKAIEPLRKLVKINPKYGQGFHMLARSLKKIRKYDEAMRFYERFAEVENSQEAWLELAKSYRKGKIFDKSTAIYQRILSEDPKNMEARIGLSQIRYANKDKAYLEDLDALYKEDPAWTRQWLKEEFNFRIYVTEKTLLSPNQAANYLGFNKIFDLTQRAFKNEVPSHFNPSKARMSFYMEELENWANTMNRYECQAEPIQTYPDRINAADDLPEVNGGKGIKSGKGAKNNGDEVDSSTRVEAILQHIRARKAQRLKEQQVDYTVRPAKPATKPVVESKGPEEAAVETAEAEPAPKVKKKRGRPRKDSK